MTLLLLPVGGCFVPVSQGPATVDVTLASYGELRVDASAQAFTVALGKRFSIAQSTPCPLLGPELAAQLDGVEVPVTSRGGKIGDEPGDDVSDNLCGNPLFELDMAPPDGPSILEISDRATTLTCHLPDLKATRQVMAVPPAPGTWRWRSGDTVTVQWSPASDLGLWATFPIEIDHVNDANVVDDISHVSNVTSDAGQIRFTLPTLTPGSYQLKLGPTGSVACGVLGGGIASTLTTFAVTQPVTIVAI